MIVSDFLTLSNRRFSLIGNIAALPGDFCVWLASPEAKFLKGKYLWANWDVDQMMERAKDIQESLLLNITLDGVVM